MAYGSDPLQSAAKPALKPAIESSGSVQQATHAKAESPMKPKSFLSIYPPSRITFIKASLLEVGRRPKTVTENFKNESSMLTKRAQRQPSRRIDQG